MVAVELTLPDSPLENNLNILQFLNLPLCLFFHFISLLCLFSSTMFCFANTVCILYIHTIKIKFSVISLCFATWSHHDLNVPHMTEIGHRVRWQWSMHRYTVEGSRMDQSNSIKQYGINGNSIRFTGKRWIHFVQKSAIVTVSSVGTHFINVMVSTNIKV